MFAPLAGALVGASAIAGALVLVLNAPAFGDDYLAGQTMDFLAAPPAPSVVQVRADWALGQVGVTDDGAVIPWADGWSGYCDGFAVAAVNAGQGDTGSLDRAEVFPDARTHYTWALDRGLVFDKGLPPAGSLVFYDSGGHAGHVAVSVGGGRVVTTQGTPGDGYQVAEADYQAIPGYAGWSWY